MIESFKVRDQSLAVLHQNDLDELTLVYQMDVICNKVIDEYGNITFPNLSRFATLNNITKLRLFRHLMTKMSNDEIEKVMLTSDKIFQLHAMIGCFTHHFHSDQDEFLKSAHPRLAYQGFYTTRCHGEPDKHCQLNIH